MAHREVQQLVVYLSWTNLQVSLARKGDISDEMSFCTDWLHFHLWMLLFLAELILILSPLLKITDGLEHLFIEWIAAQCGLLWARQLGFPVGYQPGLYWLKHPLATACFLLLPEKVLFELRHASVYVHMHSCVHTSVYM